MRSRDGNVLASAAVTAYDSAHDMSVKRKQRYSISVSAETYDRVREVVDGSLAKFVDTIVETALSDPMILSRVAGSCRQRSSKEA